MLIEGGADEPTVLDHLGVEVETTDEVNAATARLSGLGLFTDVENDTTCCYALQDKVWVRGPGAEPWEVYTVKADAPDATSIHVEIVSRFDRFGRIYSAADRGHHGDGGPGRLVVGHLLDTALLQASTALDAGLASRRLGRSWVRCAPTT